MAKAARKRRTLTEYMVRLALDTSALGEFLMNPEVALRRSGLDAEGRAVLNSGRTSVIYTAIVNEAGQRQ